MVADPPERLRRRTPQPQSDRDGDSGCLVIVQARDVATRPRALEQKATVLAILSQQTYGTVAVPQRERVGLFVRLVVVD